MDAHSAMLSAIMRAPPASRHTSLLRNAKMAPSAAERSSSARGAKKALCHASPTHAAPYVMATHLRIIVECTDLKFTSPELTRAGKNDKQPIDVPKKGYLQQLHMCICSKYGCNGSMANRNINFDLLYSTRTALEWRASSTVRAELSQCGEDNLPQKGGTPNTSSRNVWSLLVVPFVVRRNASRVVR